MMEKNMKHAATQTTHSTQPTAQAGPCFKRMRSRVRRCQMPLPRIFYLGMLNKSSPIRDHLNWCDSGVLISHNDSSSRSHRRLINFSMQSILSKSHIFNSVAPLPCVSSGGGGIVGLAASRLVVADGPNIFEECERMALAWAKIYTHVNSWKLELLNLNFISFLTATNSNTTPVNIKVHDLAERERAHRPLSRLRRGLPKTLCFRKMKHNFIDFNW